MVRKSRLGREQIGGKRRRRHLDHHANLQRARRGASGLNLLARLGQHAARLAQLFDARHERKHHAKVAVRGGAHAAHAAAFAAARAASASVESIGDRGGCAALRIQSPTARRGAARRWPADLRRCRTCGPSPAPAARRRRSWRYISYCMSSVSSSAGTVRRAAAPTGTARSPRRPAPGQTTHRRADRRSLRLERPRRRP